MRTLPRFSSFRGGIVLLLALLLAGCGNGGPTGGSQPTTPPATCATNATANARAWVANNQVVGSINGGPMTTLSNFSYPLGLPGEGQFGSDQLSAIAWAPDAKHLAVVVTVDQGPEQDYYPYIVDTATHAVTRVMLPGATVLAAPGSWVPWRLLAWANSQTLLIFTAASAPVGSEGPESFRYDLASGAASPLPGVTSAAEGVVRCSTLFYLDLTPQSQIGTSNGEGYYKGSARLHRYDLASNSEIGTPVTLGDTSSTTGSEGNVDIPGWDASPDGSHIAYQQTTVTLPASGALMTSAPFVAAHADGSGATPILTGVSAGPDALVAISPNGMQVAVTTTSATPGVISGALSGGAAHTYTPFTSTPPVWLADNSGFEAGVYDGASSNIERYPLNTGAGSSAGSVAVPGAIAPAILP